MSQKSILVGRSRSRFSFANRRQHATAHNELTIFFIIRDLACFHLNMAGYLAFDFECMIV
jgi:hypothetical protein